MSLIRVGKDNTLIIDTETTGVPKNDWKDWSECYAVQIAYIIVDNDYKIIKSCNELIKDTNHPSLPEPLSIHHITEEMRNEKGISIYEFLYSFEQDIRDFNVKNIVSHSTYFDVGLIYREAFRNNYNIAYLNRLSFYDTKLSPIYIKSRPANLSRCVELNELPINYVGKPHDAFYDVFLCQALYRATEPKAIMKRNSFYSIKHVFTPNELKIAKFWRVPYGRH